ncbi:hypothetical protein B0H10DRAFT_1956519 [Mycena sp. CBHHK59/15]|nr:hypothetical protein B0H10DRAFT_1956519 [Mycena sp. CBHHK59/15]
MIVTIDDAQATQAFVRPPGTSSPSRSSSHVQQMGPNRSTPNFGGDWMAPCVPIDFGFDLKPAPFPIHPALPSRPAPTLSPSITVVAMSPAVSPTTSTLGLQVVRPASGAWPKSSSRGVSALPDFDKLVRAELTGLLTIWPKSWLPGGPGPTLDPFAIEPGIQGTTSCLPVSTDIWGACQFQAVTTCVTIGGVCKHSMRRQA